VARNPMNQSEFKATTGSKHKKIHSSKSLLGLVIKLVVVVVVVVVLLIS